MMACAAPGEVTASSPDDGVCCLVLVCNRDNCGADVGGRFLNRSTMHHHHLTKPPMLWLATGFGLGYCPVASGTVGTLPGIPLAWALYRIAEGMGGWFWPTVFATLFVVAAVPVCGFAERQFKRKDDGRIVADEYLTFPVCMLGLPWNGLTVALAFATHRFFDILKPPPAHRLQSLRGGVGIVIDDFIAVLYSLMLNHLIVRCWPSFFGLS